MNLRRRLEVAASCWWYGHYPVVEKRSLHDGRIPGLTPLERIKVGLNPNLTLTLTYCRRCRRPLPNGYKPKRRWS